MEQTTVLVFAILSLVKAQLSSQRPDYLNQYNGVSTAPPFNQYSTSPRPDVYSSSPRYPQLNPDITNRAYPPDYGRTGVGRDLEQNYQDGDRDDYNRNPEGFRDPHRGNQDGSYYAADTVAVRRFLQQIDAQSSEECSANVGAQWNFETDVNEATQLAAVS
jgi:hypothetical protein